MLAVENLAVSYGGIDAVRGIDLSVAAGEITALIGANGAGKSSLLKAISGLVRPSSGRIRFDGIPTTYLRPHRIARLGLLQVPEGRQILGPLSVRENLELGRLAQQGRAAPESLDRICDLFPRLRERLGQVAGSLSGGEQQMLAIGRALMGRPRLLLLDEPSLGLSPVMAETVFAALKRLNADGLTILLVEQNARRALDLAQQGYVMDRGLIAHRGLADGLRHDPEIESHYLGSYSTKQGRSDPAVTESQQ